MVIPDLERFRQWLCATDWQVTFTSGDSQIWKHATHEESLIVPLTEDEYVSGFHGLIAALADRSGHQSDQDVVDEILGNDSAAARFWRGTTLSLQDDTLADRGFVNGVLFALVTLADPNYPHGLPTALVVDQLAIEVDERRKG